MCWAIAMAGAVLGTLEGGGFATTVREAYISNWDGLLQRKMLANASSNKQGDNMLKYFDAG